MSELYSRLDEDLTTRLREADIVGVGFDVPAPSAPRNVEELKLEIALQAQENERVAKDAPVAQLDRASAFEFFSHEESIVYGLSATKGFQESPRDTG